MSTDHLRLVLGVNCPDEVSEYACTTSYGFLSVDINQLINHCHPITRSLGRGGVVWGLYGAGGVNYSPAAAVTLVADVPWPGGGVPASLHSARDRVTVPTRGHIITADNSPSKQIK